MTRQARGLFAGYAEVMVSDLGFRDPRDREHRRAQNATKTREGGPSRLEADRVVQLAVSLVPAERTHLDVVEIVSRGEPIALLEFTDCHIATSFLLFLTS